MSPLDRPAALIRVLRLLAGLSLIVAIVAVVMIVRGSSIAKSEALLAVAIILGGIALFGMGLTVRALFSSKESEE